MCLKFNKHTNANENKYTQFSQLKVVRIQTSQQKERERKRGEGEARRETTKPRIKPAGQLPKNFRKEDSPELQLLNFIL